MCVEVIIDFLFDLRFDPFEERNLLDGEMDEEAAARTVDDTYGVHSLHSYFLRGGDPRVPIVYQVDRLRDGRSFATRRVTAIQHGRAIFNLQASFHDDEPGPDHDDDG